MGDMVRWSDGQMVRWSDGQMVRWSDGQMVRWSDGQMVRWSDGAIEVMGYGVAIDNGLATVTYPIELPEVSHYISIAERISGDTGINNNTTHTSMVIDALTTKAGFKARCIMAATGSPSSNGFSWRVYYANVLF